MIVSACPGGWNGILQRKTMSNTPSAEHPCMTASQFFISFKEKQNWITGQNFSQFGENRIENDQKLIFRHFPRSGLFWSFFFTVRGDNKTKPAENLYFCLIFYALANAKNRILLHRLVGAVGRVERNFATPCTKNR